MPGTPARKKCPPRSHLWQCWDVLKAFSRWQTQGGFHCCEPKPRLPPAQGGDSPTNMPAVPMSWAKIFLVHSRHGDLLAVSTGAAALLKGCNAVGDRRHRSWGGTRLRRGDTNRQQLGRIRNDGGRINSAPALLSQSREQSPMAEATTLLPYMSLHTSSYITPLFKKKNTLASPS